MMLSSLGLEAGARERIVECGSFHHREVEGPWRRGVRSLDLEDLGRLLRR